MNHYSDEIQEKFLKIATKESTITCSQCLALAQELGITTKGIGEMLTEMNIKIIKCQLGCFP